MPNYKRVRFGATYFFTVVTHQRRKILCLEPCREILRDVVKQTRDAYPFKTEAMVLLPEHIHCIWTLPENDTDYSMRWGLIKKEFTKRARHILDGMVGVAVGARHGGACRSRAAHPTEDGAADPNVGWAAPTDRPDAPHVGWAPPTDRPADPNVGWAAPTTGRPDAPSVGWAPPTDRPDAPSVGWAPPTEKPPRPTASRIKHREEAVWQRRFWEHQIRDQEDFNAHVEYIHYNPVKHGLAKTPIEWAYSSFGRYVRDGIYDRDWGAGGDMTFDDAVGNE